MALAPASAACRRRQGAALALTLTPISGTALVLLADLHASHPLFAPQVTLIIRSAIAFTEILGGDGACSGACAWPVKATPSR